MPRKSEKKEACHVVVSQAEATLLQLTHLCAQRPTPAADIHDTKKSREPKNGERIVRVSPV